MSDEKDECLVRFVRYRLQEAEECFTTACTIENLLYCEATCSKCRFSRGHWNICYMHEYKKVVV